MGTFLVHALGVGFDDIGGHIVGNFKQAAIVLDGVIVVDRCIGKVLGIGKAFLLEFDDALHQRMGKLKIDFLNIIFCHNSLFKVVNLDKSPGTDGHLLFCL